MRQIFRDYLAGEGLGRIANQLNAEQVPWPSAADPERNRHRHALGWRKSAIRAILTNPRYTGYEVWNRTRGQEELFDPGDVTLGHRKVMRRTTAENWVTSNASAHPALIGSELFESVQCELRERGERARRQRAVTARSYALAGLVTCELCGRLMAGTWTNKQTYYRCRATAPHQSGHPANVYLRENDLVARIQSWIKSHIDPTHLLGLEEGAANAAFRALGLSLAYNSGNKTLTVTTTTEVSVELTLHAGSPM